MATPKDGAAYTPRCAGVPKNLVAWVCSLRCGSHYAKKSPKATNLCANRKLNIEGEPEHACCSKYNPKCYARIHGKSRKKTKRKIKRGRRKKSASIMCIPCQKNQSVLFEPRETNTVDKNEEIKQLMYCANADEVYPHTSVQKCKNRRITFQKCPRYGRNKNEEDGCCYEEQNEEANNEINDSDYYDIEECNENSENEEYRIGNMKQGCCNFSRTAVDYDSDDDYDEEESSDEDNEINFCDTYQSRESINSNQMCYRCEMEEAARRQNNTKSKCNIKLVCRYCGKSHKANNERKISRKFTNNSNKCSYQNQMDKNTAANKRKIKNYNFVCKSDKETSKLRSAPCSCKEKYQMIQDYHVCDYCDIRENKQIEYERVDCSKTFATSKNQTVGRKIRNIDYKCICQEMCVNLEQFDSENNENIRGEEKACECSKLERQKRPCPGKRTSLSYQKTNKSRNYYQCQDVEASKIERKSNCLCANISVKDGGNIQMNNKMMCFNINEVWGEDNQEEEDKLCDCCICKQQKTVKKPLPQNGNKRLQCGNFQERKSNKNGARELDVCNSICFKNQKSDKVIPTPLCFCQNKKKKKEDDYEAEKLEDAAAGRTLDDNALINDIDEIIGDAIGVSRKN